MSEKKKELTMFEKLWESGKDALRSIEKPFEKSEMKSALKSAVRDATKKKFDAQKKLHDEYAKLADFNINKCIEHKETIRKADASIVHIEAIWEEIFDSKMPSALEE